MKHAGASRILPANASNLVASCLLLSGVLVGVKAALLPLDATSPGELFRWCLRLAIVCAPDICFVAGVGAVCLTLARLAQWHVLPRVTWKLACSAIFLVLAAYGLLAMWLYEIRIVPFTVRLLWFAGGPSQMSSSVAEYVTTARLALLASVPLAVVGLSLITRRLVEPVLRRLPAVAWMGAAVMVVAYGAVCHAYVAWRWPEPNRWERRIAHSPHFVLLQSVVEESLGSSTLAAAGEDFDDSDLQASETTTLAELPFEYPAPGTRRPKNVVVFFLESIGSEYFGLYHPEQDTCPHLAQAGRNSVVFDNFYVSVPNSCKSLVSLLCSTYPRIDWDLIVEKQPDLPLVSLPQVLAQRGYRTSCLHSGYWRWRNRDQFLRHQQVDTLIDAEQLSEAKINSWGVSDQAMMNAALDWIDLAPEQPFFLLAYTIETHHPYAVPRHPVKFDTGDEERNRYQNAIRATDERIAEFLAELKRRNLLDDTLIVITADHGESFGQHEQREHMFGVYEPNVHIPLVLLHPSLAKAPRRVTAVREQVDVAPTVLNLLGIPQPSAPWQGRNLLGDAGSRAYFFSVANHVVLGLRDGNLKYHYYVSTGDEELFDLARDPNELVNLAPQRTTQCKTFRRRVCGLVHHQHDLMNVYRLKSQPPKHLAQRP